MAADLLRAPPLTKQFDDYTAEVIVAVDPASMVTCSTSGGTPMGVEGLIPAAGCRVTPHLPGNRRRRTSEPLGDRTHAQPGMTQISDLDALVLGQVPRADLADR
jgi:hypothetical protein